MTMMAAIKKTSSYDSYQSSDIVNAQRKSNSERRSYLQHLTHFEHAIRTHNLDAAREHLKLANVPQDQIDIIIGRIEANPDRYGYAETEA